MLFATGGQTIEPLLSWTHTDKLILKSALMIPTFLGNPLIEPDFDTNHSHLQPTWNKKDIADEALFRTDCTRIGL